MVSLYVGGVRAFRPFPCPFPPVSPLSAGALLQPVPVRFFFFLRHSSALFAGRGLRFKILKSYCLHFFFSLSYLMLSDCGTPIAPPFCAAFSMPQHGHFIPASPPSAPPFTGRRGHSRRRREPSPPSARTLRSHSPTISCRSGMSRISSSAGEDAPVFRRDVRPCQTVERLQRRLPVTPRRRRRPAP